jgi:sulfite exporter TauE/SafE
VETGYLLAFTTGMIGGFGHCIGMCGPLVASYAMADAGQSKPLLDRLLPHALYNSGRITTYALVGGIMGMSGSFINVAGKLANIQNVVAVLAGIMMIVMGMSIAGISGSAAWIEKHNTSVLRAAHAVTASVSRFRYYPLGLTLGLLPCGLSYTVFISSAGTGSTVSGMLNAFLFGLGTLPALLVFGALVSSLSAKLRIRIYRLGGLIVILMGMYYLNQGIKQYAAL